VIHSTDDLVEVAARDEPGLQLGLHVEMIGRIDPWSVTLKGKDSKALGKVVEPLVMIDVKAA